MSRIPTALALLEQSDAVDWMLGSMSNKDGLEFSLGRSKRRWKLVLDELRCMFPGGSGMMSASLSMYTRCS